MYLSEEYNIGPSLCGYLYGIGLIFYCVNAPIVSHLISKHTSTGAFRKNVMNKKLAIFIGLVFSGIMFILVGPDPLTGIHPSVYVTGLTMALT